MRCRDKYEAQKLASLIFIRDAGETYITGIINVVQEELVVALKDKSAHSVLMYDGCEVERLADFMQSVFDGIHALASTKVAGDAVKITKRTLDSQ